jgi:hypothetical protein
LAKVKAKYFPTHKSGVMNGTEKAYSLRLAMLQSLGEVIEYKFEALTLKLAQDTRYTPDFYVINSKGEIEFHEVKGHLRDDALVKIKVAAEMFPFIFRMFIYKGKQFTERDFTVR